MSSDVVTLRKPEAARAPVVALTPAETGRRLRGVAEAIGRVVQGKREVVDLMLAGVVARGHLLVEDVPGVGKTTLAQALARALGLGFSRIQVTSDLLPSDVLGVTVYDRDSGRFEFRRGPIFQNVVLADEVNRTTPRTQSALLEAMSEAQVSLDGKTWPLPEPFLLVATQNPHEHAGTYPLPESQLDRFLLRLEVGYPSRETERDILLTRGGVEPLETLEPVIGVEDLLAMQAALPGVHLDPAVADYALQIVDATRRNGLLALGVSTRGALLFVRAARAKALLDGRAFVLPDDFKAVAVPALAHRVVPAGHEAGEMDRRESARIIADILERTPVPA